MISSPSSAARRERCFRACPTEDSLRCCHSCSYNSDVFAELAASPNLFALPNVPQSTEYNTIIKEEVELALNLKQTPEQALQNIYDKGSELFK